MKDWCTSFPEYWYKYEKSDGFIGVKKVYIGNICKKHDENCGSHGFYKGLWKARIVGAITIATVASIACWFKYTSKMIKRL